MSFGENVFVIALPALSLAVYLVLAWIADYLLAV